MAELTRTPDYKIAGTIAPEAHSFEHAGRTWHVHRFVDDKGKAAIRFRDNWQVSHQGVPMTKTVSPTPDHVAAWFIDMYARMVQQMGSEGFEKEITDTFRDNLAKIARHAPTYT